MEFAGKCNEPNKWTEYVPGQPASFATQVQRNRAGFGVAEIGSSGQINSL